MIGAKARVSSGSPFRAVRIAIAVAGVLACACVDAAAPKQVAAFGLALDATPDSVRSFFAEHYATCTVARSIYRDGASGAASHTADLTVNAGLAEHDPASLDPCPYSPAGEGIMDSIEARFTHPDVDSGKPLYSLLAYRAYPDAVQAEPPRVRVSFDDLRKELIRTYGKPIDERKERIVSYAANTAASIGVAKKVKREDWLVRYLWAVKGKLRDADRVSAGCDCAERYVEAAIEISQSPSTIPRNKPYALSLRLLVEDPALRRRQDAWNAQRRQPKR